MEEKIYVMKDGSAHGPFTRAEVQKKLLSDEFSLDMAAYTQGQEKSPRTLRKILGLQGQSTLKAPEKDTEAERRRAAAAREINKIAQREEKNKEREMRSGGRRKSQAPLALLLLLLILGGGFFYYFTYLEEDLPLPEVPFLSDRGEAPSEDLPAAEGNAAGDAAAQDPEAAGEERVPNPLKRSGTPNVQVKGGGRYRDAFVADFQGEPKVFFSAMLLDAGPRPRFAIGSSNATEGQITIAFTSEVAMAPAAGKAAQIPVPKAAAPGEVQPEIGKPVQVGFRSKSPLRIVEVTPQFLRVQDSRTMHPGAPAVYGEGEDARIIGIYQGYETPGELEYMSGENLTREGTAFIWRIDTPAKWVPYVDTNYAKQKALVDNVKLLTANLSQFYRPGGKPISLSEFRSRMSAITSKHPTLKSIAERLEGQALNNLAPESQAKLVRDTLGSMVSIAANDIQQAKSQLTYGPLQLQLIDQEYARKNLIENFKQQRNI